MAEGTSWSNMRGCMKRLFFLLPVFAALGSNGQPADGDDSNQAEASRELKEKPTPAKVEKPNEITVGNLTMSGIVAQTIKADNPLQLINPAAPEEYGSGELNVVREPVGGRVSGLKFLSFNF